MHSALVVCSALLTVSAFAASSEPAFEANLGQGPATARYLARAANARIVIEDTSARWLPHNVTLRWDGANRNPAPNAWALTQPALQTTYYCNVTPALCRTPIPSYRRLTRTNLYPNIDWVLYSNGNDFEYDLIVHPGASPDTVRLTFDGASAHIDQQGQLIAASLTQRAPRAYQWIGGEKHLVPATWQAANNGSFRIAVGGYRKDLPLILDPVVASATIDGGSEDDVTTGAFIDAPATSTIATTYRYGLTNSQDWTGESGRRGSDVFVEISSSSQYTRVIWGGSGDEQPTGSVFTNNSYLYVCGWSSSPDAPRVPASAFATFRAANPYAGGASDGFILGISFSGLVEAGFFGGPGADRINACGISVISGSTDAILLAGETDQPDWPGASVSRTGPGGKLDAFAAIWRGPTLRLFTLGGTGDDRALALRNGSGGTIAFAGESDSPDFPATTGRTAAQSVDTWIANLGLDLQWAAASLFGGSRADRLAGIAQPDMLGPVFLAGTTASPDLPAAANTYGGGDSDGFLTRLDPITLAPEASTYLGGAARDQITSLHPTQSSLLLGGSTDSPEIAVPGITRDMARGGLDGLVLVASTDLQILRGIRLGGTGDDRVFDARPARLGTALVSGSTASRDWIHELNSTASWAGNADAFTLQLAYASIEVRPDLPSPLPSRVGPLRDIYIGAGRTQPFTANFTSEPSLNGILRVRSSDPSKLLVSLSGGAGVPSLLLRASELGSGAVYFAVNAMADEGEADIILDAPAPGSNGDFYPPTRVRIRLAPTGVFWESRPPLVIVPGSSQVIAFLAPVLPDGRPGWPQNPRADLPAAFSDGEIVFSSSDPQNLRFPDASPRPSSRATYSTFPQGTEGEYIITATAPQLLDAPSDSIAIRIAAAVPDPSRLLSNPSVTVSKHHFVPIGLQTRAGDVVTITSTDPARVRVGMANTEASPSLQFAAASSSTAIYVTGFDSRGEAAVRIECLRNGNTIVEDLTVQFTASRVEPSLSFTTITAGTFFDVPLRSSGLDSLGRLTGASGTPSPVVFSNPPISDTAVFRLLAFRTGFSSIASYSFQALKPGTVTLEFPSPDSPPVRVTITVLAPRLDFGISQLLIPAGASASITPTSPVIVTPPFQLRLTPGADLSFAFLGPATTQIDFLHNGGGLVRIDAARSRPGQRASLLATAPGIEATELPIRITELAVVPATTEQRAVAGSGALLRLELLPALPPGASEGRLSNAFQFQIPLRVSATATPTGICDLPEPFESQPSTGSLTLSFRCPNPGTATITVVVEGGNGVLAGGRQVITQRVVISPPSPVLPSGLRVLTGAGLQTLLNLYPSQFSSNFPGFTGTLRSSDPSKVLLSLNQRTLGSASISFSQANPARNILVQGLASEGVVPLIAEAANGTRTEIPVFLFGSTLAIRRDSSPDFAGSSNTAQYAFGQSQQIVLDVVPLLVEPNTGSLFSSGELSIRGGTDRFFVALRSSEPAVTALPSGNILFNEGEASARVILTMLAPGETELRLTQPPGFIDTPGSALRVRLFEPFVIVQPAITGPGVQVAAALRFAPVPGVDSSRLVIRTVTVTSLDPSRLLLANDSGGPGLPQVTTSPSFPQVYLRGVPGAPPGGTVLVRIEGAGIATSEVPVQITAAVLQSTMPERVALAPGITVISISFSLGFPGVTASATGIPGPDAVLRARVSDHSILQLARPTVPLSSSLSLEVRFLWPGEATVQIEAPAGIINQASSFTFTVSPFQLPTTVFEGVPYLVTPVLVGNPLAAPLAMTFSSAGARPVRFSTSATGAGAASPLTVTLGPRETRTLYFETGGPSGNAAVLITAPGFQNDTRPVTLSDGQLSWDIPSPLRLSTGPTLYPIPLVLHRFGILSPEFPAGSTLTPFRIQLQSSNPQVVRFTTSTVDFLPGESRKLVQFQVVGPGTATLTFAPPAAFSTRPLIPLTVIAQ